MSGSGRKGVGARRGRDLAEAGGTTATSGLASGFVHRVWRGLDDPDFPRQEGWGTYIDPVVGYLALPPLLRQALDLDEVQRLRWIKQLSSLEVVFPGASHSRFEHSVGVMTLAGITHDMLVAKAYQFPDAPPLTIATKVAVMLAGLFHDIGHGPYSHTFEMFLGRIGSTDRKDPDGHALKPHVHATHDLIDSPTGEATRLSRFLNKVADLLARQMREDGANEREVETAEIIRPRGVAQIATGGVLAQRHKDYDFLSQIVASEIDVDRLDYIRRDSIQTGIAPSLDPLDPLEIISAYTLALVHDEEPRYGPHDKPGRLPGGTPTSGRLNWQLRLELKAAQALEALFGARDAAYRKLYYHPTQRAAQEMMILALQYATGCAPFATQRRNDLIEEYSRYRDRKLLEALEDERRSAQLVRALEDRRLYEPLPFAIRVRDLGTHARNELLKLGDEANEKVRGSMVRLAQSLREKTENPHPSDLILDVTAVPVLEADAYLRRFLWEPSEKRFLRIKDEFAQVGYALVEALPHLQALHGYLTPDRQMHADYVANIQRLVVFAPVDFIAHLKKRFRDAVEGESGSETDVATDLVKSLISPVLEAIREILGPDDGLSDALRDANDDAVAWFVA